MAQPDNSSLRKKIMDLEDQLKDGHDMIQALTHNEKESEKKMKALNLIHS